MILIQHSDGNVYNWACTPDMAKAFDMFIYASAGYAMTTDNKLVILDMYTAETIDVVGEQQIRAKQPVKIGLYTSFAVPTLDHTWVQADGVYVCSFFLLFLFIVLYFYLFIYFILIL